MLKKIPVTTVLYAAMLLMSVFLIICVSSQSNQAALSSPMQIYFTGEYSQKEGNWQTLDGKTEISSYDGDVVLRGRFSDPELPEGAEMRFYLYHIGMTVWRNGELLYESSVEKSRDMCGSTWVSWNLPALSPDDVFEIHLHNPHHFGNRNAYQQFCNSMYIGGDVSMKNYLERQNLPYQVISIFILVVSVAFMGTAVGYWLLQLPDSSLLLKSGVMSLMMGIYMYLSVKNFSVWNGNLAFHTCARQIAMMTAAWLLGACVAELLHGKRRKAAKTAVYVLMGTDFLLMAMTFAGKTEIYDTGIYWAVVQGAVSLLLLGLTVMEEKGLLQASVIALLTVLLLELVNTWMGWWQSGICVKIVFTVLFVFHLVRAAWLIAKNQQNSIRAEKLGMELQNSRIVLAMSQIRTHFVFNILNAISGMCAYDPQKADEILVMFSHYLRKNINIMEEDRPESFTKALDYLEEYVALEQVRFGEKIRFEKEIGVDNFQIPPLVLQPLVENAIRHGLLHKKQGGTVCLHTWTENGDILIAITDDGVGFNPADVPGEESVGMKNVRFRLKYMVEGSMEVKSIPGQGTTVTIRIPGKNTAGGVKKK